MVRAFFSDGPIPEVGGVDLAMTEGETLQRIGNLRLEHRDLDAAIEALLAGSGDQLQVARLKKRKLRLRDEIAALEDRLIPDIIA